MFGDPQSTSWADLDPMTLIGAPVGHSVDAMTGNLGVTAVQSVPPLWHPDHPFAVVMVIAALTVGLAGVSTHLRLGPFKASASAGKD